MTPSKTQRWLDLLALLVGNRQPISIDQIMEQVPAYRVRWTEGSATERSSARRMFERDKDELRRLGIPIDTRRYRVDGLAESEGYLILRGNFYLPYLELLREAEEEEIEGRAHSSPTSGSPHVVGRVSLLETDARAAILALREVLTLPSFPFEQDARSALRKLTFDLDPALADPEDAGRGSGPVSRILDRPGGADPEGVLGVLLNALYDRYRVIFQYHSIGRDVVEPREVEPWGLLFQWGSWYLAARDAESAPEVRLFRVDRMAKARRAGSRGGGREFEVPENFDIRSYAGRNAWEMGTDATLERDIVVRFLPPASRLAARNGWGEQVKEEADGSVLRSFSVRRADPFLRWVLSMAGEAQVVSPSEMRESLIAMAREVGALHREAL